MEKIGKAPFSMGKSTISMVIFNSYVTNYQRAITRDILTGFDDPAETMLDKGFIPDLQMEVCGRSLMAKH
jgi:hypothetical protein